MVHCLKLIKPYGKKKEEEDDEDNNDDDNDGKNLIAEGRDVERDVACHAYEIGQFAHVIIQLLWDWSVCAQYYLSFRLLVSLDMPLFVCS